MTNRQLFSRMFRYMRPYMILYIIGIGLYSSQQFVFPLVSGLFVGNVMAGILAQDFSQVVSAIQFMAIMLVGVMLAMGLGAYLYVMTQAYALRDLRLKLIRAFMKSSLESNKHSGEGIAIINTDSSTAADIYGNALAPFLTNIIAAVFSSIAIFIIDWRMGLGAVGVGLIAFLCQSGFARPLARLGKDRLEANSDSVKSMSNIFGGALTIRAYNRQDRSLFQFDLENGRLKKLAFRQAFFGMWQSLFTTVQGWLSMVLTFALGGWLVATGRLGFAQLMIIPSLAEAIGDAMSQIGATYAGLHPPLVAAGRVFALVDEASGGEKSLNATSVDDFDKSDSPQDTTNVDDLVTAALSRGTADVDDSDKAALSQDATDMDDLVTAAFPQDTSDVDDLINPHEITLRNLNFAYKGATNSALTDINLSIKKNSMVAFVGASGSGKSTLLRAIIGLHQREDLGIAIGNTSFASMDISNWRRNFAYVDQSAKLFDMTIADNIAMGMISTSKIEATDVHPSVTSAAKRAFAHDFITALPEDYLSQVGEKGASLSGGQRQRLAIARALCRKAPILVFDEATSALDAESENNIMETIQSLRDDHTILITTHNLRNISSADCIVVMDAGRIAETGTHEELIELGGIYAGLVREETNAI